MRGLLQQHSSDIDAFVERTSIFRMRQYALVPHCFLFDPGLSRAYVKYSPTQSMP